MKRVMFFILLIVFLSVNAEIIEIDQNKSNDFSIQQHNDRETNLNLNIGSINAFKGEQDYDVLTIENGQLYTEEIGRPQVPYYRRVIAIPDHGDVRIEITNIKSRTLDQTFNIQPAQMPLPDVKNPEIEWIKDEEFYSRDQFFPGKQYEIKNIGSIRSFRIATVYFYPVQYNAATGETEVIYDCDINIIYEGMGENEMTKTIPVSDRWIPIYEQMLWNWDFVKDSKPKTSSVKGNNKSFNDNTFFDEGDYLIIVVSNEMTAKIKELAAWKTKLGYTPVIKQVNPAISVSALHDTINYCYSNWGIPPEFVLIVGEGEENEVANHIESHLFACSGYSYGIEGDTRNDHYYSLQPNNSDWYSDLFISRFPAEDSTELGVWIDKVIEYESNPPPGEWMTSYFAIGDVESGRIFDRTARLFGLNLMADGYTVIDTLIESNFADGAMGAHVVDSIDDGYNVLVFRGHGDEGSYFGFYGGGDNGYDDMFMRTDVPNMEATSMGMGFMFAPTCLANNFTYPYYESMGELMVNMTGKGITGYFGATNVSLSFYNDSMALGLSHALTGASGTREFQVVSVYGKNYMETYPGGSGTYFELEHYLMNEVGDPACRIWTKVPDTLIATHDASYIVGTNNIDITVRDENSTLIANATVTVWDTTGTDTVLRIGTSNASGLVSFSNVQFLDSGMDEVFITASKEDYIPYVGDADVIGGAPCQPEIFNLFNYARVPVLRPSLSFVSEDLENDDIVYRILYDDDPAFSSPDSITTASHSSGDTVDFVFPSDLSDNTTYWWKVKAGDPAGSGYFGGYSSVRSFTVFTPLGAGLCSWYQSCSEQFTSNTFSNTFIDGDSIRLYASGGIAVDTQYMEDFESGSMPAGWSVNNGDGDGFTWYVSASGMSDLSGYEPPLPGAYYAYYSDDDAGSGNSTAEEYLYSPGIPVSTADTVYFSFAYGMRNYSVDPDQSLHGYYSIYSGGSWSSWTQMLAIVGGGGNGTVNLDLTSQMPFDSIKAYWVYDDNTAWGYAAAIDNVCVYDKSVILNNTGSFISEAIDYDDLNNTYARTQWGNVTWMQSSDNDSICVQMLYHNGVDWVLIPDGDLPGNSAGFYGNGEFSYADINALNPHVYNPIKVSFTLYRDMTKSPIEPVIKAIEVGNTNTSMQYVNMLSISAQFTGSAVMINWQASVEVNNALWLIERSDGNGDFKTIGQLEANQGNYSYIDKKIVSNEHIYRISAVDCNGSITSFAPVKVLTGMIPSVFALKPVYPTLIHDNAIISYAVPALGKVNISVFDISGREIKQLINTENEPGYYRISWNCTDDYNARVAPGTYFIRMKSGDFLKTEKAVIIQ